MLEQENDAEITRLEKLGGAPIGLMQHLSAEEYLAITFLRRWCGTNIEKYDLEQDLILALGFSLGKETIQRFDLLCEILLCFGRRPLIRYRNHCECFGADEGCFAQLLTRAVFEEKEETMLMALLLVSPSLATQVVDLSLKIGNSIKSLVMHEKELILSKLN